ncbi:succinyl synthetase alpha subunit [Fusarium mundagurra]|uniref:Succinyl synthetase alpha subunit n=1 Tax=Fusarium mundagurra TaxID=1567541 RepID=A0A8H6D3U6_9HYPO|nr:succinyl synthetase alpha subunit [Fusarium mundagurra]
MALRPTLTNVWRLSRSFLPCRSTKYLSTHVPRHQVYDDTIANLNIDKDTRVIYQGFTGKAATINAKDTIAYGTNVVGGVSPGKGGQEHLGLPVFDTVREAMEQVKPHATSIFVPAQFAAAAIIEAIEAEVPLVVTVAEHIPVHDMMRVHGVLKTQSKTRLVGPNCPGIIAPEQCRIGIMPHKQYKRGTIGIVSKSGTLSYEAVGSTSNAGLGQSLVVGMGGDMLPGTTLVDALKLFFDHPGTEGIIVIGEIGGEAELRAAEAIKEYRRRTTEIPKPIIAMVAGKTAPEGRTMGHAGALLQSGDISAEAKAKALADSGAIVVPHPGVMGQVMKDLISTYTDRIRMSRYPLGSEVEYLTATPREL